MVDSDMSILSKNNSENSAPFFHEFKKQASFFFKEKIKTARLALTDVTPTELLTEEATSGNPWAPDTRTLASISRSAFEIDDYMRVVEILHKRLLKFEKKYWRLSYNSLIVLEHLLTHGPESVAEEFQCDKDVIREMESFQHIDEKGFNWGLAVRKKSERVMKLLEKGPLLKEERDKSRKLSRGIQGFGSFTQRSSSAASQGILREKPAFGTYARSHSQFSSHENQENQLPCNKEEGLFIKTEVSKPSKGGVNIFVSVKRTESSSGSTETETSVKENMAPDEEESTNLLLDGTQDSRIGTSEEDDHPFTDTNNTQSTASLLAVVQ